MRLLDALKDLGYKRLEPAELEIIARHGVPLTASEWDDVVDTAGSLAADTAETP